MPSIRSASIGENPRRAVGSGVSGSSLAYERLGAACLGAVCLEALRLLFGRLVLSISKFDTAAFLHNERGCSGSICG
jgi:hypothetical protein